MKPLEAILKQQYRMKFGAPFTGRISLTVPFLPFTKAERSVVVHKFMLAFATEIRQPIDRQPDVNRLVGHCRLSIKDDGKVCATLTDNNYNDDLGARSLANAVEGVENSFMDEYTNDDTEATEDINNGPLQPFIVSCNPVGEDMWEVVVSRGGLDAERDDEASDGEVETLDSDDVEGLTKEKKGDDLEVDLSY